jgi:uncharacterized protein YndB with AHSA1/START domain
MIRKTALLGCVPEKAFALFTERAGEWWPTDRRHLQDPASAIRIEPSGRFYELATDGREAELGKVRHYEPPKKLILDWYPGTGPQNPTHVEVVFEPEGSATRITVVHGPGDRSEDVYPSRVAAYDKSWTLVLEALVLAANA